MQSTFKVHESLAYVCQVKLEVDRFAMWLFDSKDVEIQSSVFRLLAVSMSAA